VDPSVTEDYDIGDDSNFISFCDSIRFQAESISLQMREVTCNVSRWDSRFERFTI
jgi:hypothetical protein